MRSFLALILVVAACSSSATKTPPKPVYEPGVVPWQPPPRPPPPPPPPPPVKEYGDLQIVGPPSAEIIIDGKRQGRLGADGGLFLSSIEATTHEVAAILKDYYPQTSAVSVSPHSSVRIELHLQPLQTTPTFDVRPRVQLEREASTLLLHARPTLPLVRASIDGKPVVTRGCIREHALTPILKDCPDDDIVEIQDLPLTVLAYPTGSIEVTFTAQDGKKLTRRLELLPDQVVILTADFVQATILYEAFPDVDRKRTHDADVQMEPSAAASPQ